MYTCIVTQRDGLRKINLLDNKQWHNDAVQIHDIKWSRSAGVIYCWRLLIGRFKN